MDLELTSAERAFQDEVAGFLADSFPAHMKEKVARDQHFTKDDNVQWWRILNKKGWHAPAWPVEYGGCDWTPMQHHIYQEQMAMAGAPVGLAFGISMVGPVIYTFANQAQKDHYLPRILNVDDWWCQGYSEPGAGSDLAGLKTRAVREGDKYIVNGQKTWTTLGQHADMIFCLVRTDPEAKKQQGISFLLIDMKTPGIEVRPIITIEGGHEVNEVFFDNVEVPVENLVGEENKGWTYAKFLLSHERSGIAQVGGSKRELAKLKKIAAVEQADGRPLAQNARFRDKMSEIEVDLMALEMFNLRVLAKQKKGEQPGIEANMLKIRGSQIGQRIRELQMQAVGPYAMPYTPEAFEAGWNGTPVGPDYAAALAPHYFNHRKTSIYGGSNEIQRNILTKAHLGL